MSGSHGLSQLASCCSVQAARNRSKRLARLDVLNRTYLGSLRRNLLEDIIDERVPVNKNGGQKVCKTNTSIETRGK